MRYDGRAEGEKQEMSKKCL